MLFNQKLVILYNMDYYLYIMRILKSTKLYITDVFWITSPVPVACIHHFKCRTRTCLCFMVDCKVKSACVCCIAEVLI